MQWKFSDYGGPLLSQKLQCVQNAVTEFTHFESGKSSDSLSARWFKSL